MQQTTECKQLKHIALIIWLINAIIFGVIACVLAVLFFIGVAWGLLFI